MKTFFSRRMLILFPLACAAIYGCEHEEEVVVPAELSDVLYEGGATDEALVALDSALDQKDPVADATRAPVLDMPTAAQLPKSPVPTFTWHAGATARVYPGRTNAHEGPVLIEIPAAKSAFQVQLSEFLGPIKAARAHGDPLVGPATFLVFSTATDAKLVRVFTNQTSYTPAQTVWDKIVGAKAEVTLSLIGAEFDNNRIADGGGPFQGTKYVFTVAP